MCAVFWDRQDLLLVDFLAPDEPINANVYCETLKKLHRAIQNKCRGMFINGIVLIHGNARPHTANMTTQLL